MKTSGHRRALRAVFVSLGLISLLPACAVARGSEAALGCRASASQVGKYHRVDFELAVPWTHRNPFDPHEVEVTLEIRTPGGQTQILPAFWMQAYQREVLQRGRRDWLYPTGPAAWRARFAPQQIGRYEAVAKLKDANREVRSPRVSFDCVPSSDPGFLRTSLKDPRFLAFSEGRPMFAIGQNLAFIGPTQYVTLARADEIFDKLSANGANFLRVWTCCEDWAMAIEARKSAWGRSWGWKPPFAPTPDADDPADRRCIQLGGDQAASVNLSTPNPLAVRPGTRYVLSGKLRTAATDASVKLSAGSLDFGPPLQAERAGVWTGFQREFETGGDQRFIDQIVLRLEGGGAAWLDELSLREAAGGAELLWEAAIRDPIRGFYNPTDCFLLDQLVESAERKGIYLQLCLVTRDLYMSSLKDEHSDEYAQAIRDAKNLLRYAVARWGYSTHVAAWEYFNEIDPRLPTDRFYDELGAYLEQIDVYRHLRTTSTWAPSPKDWEHPRLDIAQTHHYIRPADKEQGHDEVAVVLQRVGLLRQHAPRRPALLAEFGLAEDNWQRSAYMKQDADLVHFHNALWSSALSGASGTALFWWWELLDPMDAYRHYAPLSKFMADVPLDAGLEATSARAAGGDIRVIGLQGRDRAYLWLFNPQATWWNQVVQKKTPGTVASARLELPDLAAGTYRILWWDTDRGVAVHDSEVTLQTGNLSVEIPPFARDLACKIVMRPKRILSTVTPLLLLSVLVSDARSQDPNSLTPEEKRAGWRLLFDGKTTAGWRGYKSTTVPASWRVENGSLLSRRTRGESSGDIITVDQFADFELVWEWKMTAGNNSGMIYRATEEKASVWETGPEYQILDNQGHLDGLNPLSSAGACYSAFAPAKDMTRPLGQWNQSRIIAAGNHVEHWMNGGKLLEYDVGSRVWQAHVKTSKFFPSAYGQSNWGKVPQGHIGLQDYGGAVEFRGIKIRTLEPAGK